MLKLSVTLMLEAHCPQCDREGLPLGENNRYGVVAVCPGCGWEHQVQFFQKGLSIETGEVLSEISMRLQEALTRMDLPQDVHLTPVRERRETNLESPVEDSHSTLLLPPDPPSEFPPENPDVPPF
jgi:uncharacterized Zn finger protein (UPF0148 family)